MWLTLGAIFAGQLVKGVAGFGSALVAVPLLAASLPPSTAILLVMCSDLVSGVWLTWSARRHIAPTLVTAMLLTLFPGQWLGTSLLTGLPVATVRAAIALLVGGYGLSLVIRPVREGRGELVDLPEEPRPMYAAGAAIGGIAGVLSGLAGVPGPALDWFLRRHFVPEVTRAHLLAVLLPASAALIVVLATRDAVDDAGWDLVPWTVPASVAGGALGARLAGRLSPAATARAVGLLLVAAAWALMLRR